MMFNVIFNSTSVISWQPVHLSMCHIFISELPALVSLVIGTGLANTLNNKEDIRKFCTTTKNKAKGNDKPMGIILFFCQSLSNAQK